MNSHKVLAELVTRRRGLMYFSPGMSASQEAIRSRAITLFDDFHRGVMNAEVERVVVGSATNFLARCAKKLCELPPVRPRLGPKSQRRPNEIEAEAMALAGGTCLEFLRDVLGELAPESRRHLLGCFRRLTSRLKKAEEVAASPYGRGEFLKDLGTITGYFERAK